MPDATLTLGIDIDVINLDANSKRNLKFCSNPVTRRQVQSYDSPLSWSDASAFSRNTPLCSAQVPVREIAPMVPGPHHQIASRCSRLNSRFTPRPRDPFMRGQMVHSIIGTFARLQSRTVVHPEHGSSVAKPNPGGKRDDEPSWERGCKVMINEISANENVRQSLADGPPMWRSSLIHEESSPWSFMRCRGMSRSTATLTIVTRVSRRPPLAASQPTDDNLSVQRSHCDADCYGSTTAAIVTAAASTSTPAAAAAATASGKSGGKSRRPPSPPPPLDPCCGMRNSRMCSGSNGVATRRSTCAHTRTHTRANDTCVQPTFRPPVHATGWSKELFRPFGVTGASI